MILPRSIRMTPSRRAPKDASEDPGGGSITAGAIVTESEMIGPRTRRGSFSIMARKCHVTASVLHRTVGQCHRAHMSSCDHLL
jgi:hypothetical protein